jgi:hypothetical protein
MYLVLAFSNFKNENTGEIILESRLAKYTAGKEVSGSGIF